MIFSRTSKGSLFHTAIILRLTTIPLSRPDTNTSCGFRLFSVFAVISYTARETSFFIFWSSSLEFQKWDSRVRGCKHAYDFGLLSERSYLLMRPPGMYKRNTFRILLLILEKDFSEDLFNT
jgi:hypothetical protein